MKKRNLLLLTIASTMLLTGCGKKETNTSISSIDSQTPTSTIASNSVNSIEKNWTDKDKQTIASILGVSGLNIPYIDNTSYEINDDAEYSYSGYIDIVTTKENYDAFIAKMKALYSDHEEDIDEDGDKWDLFATVINKVEVEIDCVGFVEDGVFIAEIQFYQVNPIDTGDDDDNTNTGDSWTVNDTNEIASILGVSGLNIPYIENNGYTINEDTEYYYSGYILADATKASFDAFLNKLIALYPDHSTYVEPTYNDTWHIFKTTIGDVNIIIETTWYEEDGEQTVEIDFYQYSNEEDEDDNDEEDNTSSSTRFDSGNLNIPSSYPSSPYTTTVNGISFETSINVCDAITQPYSQANFPVIQIRKATHSSVTGESTKGYIRNTSASESTNTITVQVITTVQDATRVVIPTVYGANQAIEASSNTQEKATYSVSTGTSTNVTSSGTPVLKYLVTYTFTQEFTFFKIVNDSSSAMYLGAIELNPNGSSEITEQDDWTSQDKQLINTILGVDNFPISYIENEGYEIFEDEEYDHSGYILANATQANFNEFINKLIALYPDHSTYVEPTYNDTWHLFEITIGDANFIIETTWYEEDGEQTVEIDFYQYSDDDGDDEDDGGDDEHEDDGGNTGDDITTPAPTKKINLSSATIKYQNDLSPDMQVDSIGSQKVLVIPVDFQDYDANELGYSLEVLDKAFNTGTKADNLIYPNVSSYFAESSYGKLSLDFDIYTSWIRMDHTFEEYEEMSHPLDFWGMEGRNSSVTNEQIILDEALAKLSASGLDLSQYDLNNDGLIDSIVIINSGSVDPSEDNSNLGWAWQYYNYLADQSTKEIYSGETYYEPYSYNNVSAGKYLWASYQFLMENEEGFERKDGKLNTYTFIHEFSHVLGAEDYYSYEESNDPHVIIDPLESHDIMDRECGDHNPFSKMNFGWISEVQLVQGEGLVTLRSFEEYGDVVIIANSWSDEKGTYQEYWALEYYTNTGLNGSGNGYFDETGIVTYHVNATLKEEDGYFIFVNSNDYSEENDNRLVKFTKTQSGKFVLTSGDKSSSTDKDEKGKKIPYTYEVVEEKDGTITIKFIKNA